MERDGATTRVGKDEEGWERTGKARGSGDGERIYYSRILKQVSECVHYNLSAPVLTVLQNMLYRV